MAEPPVLSSLHSTTLALPPSCIECVPGCAEWVVMGTYFLDRSADEDEEKGDEDEEEQGKGEGEEKRAQKRSGSLVLARLEEGMREITITSTHPTPFAIFDLHFSPHSTLTNTTPSSHLLGLASSTGSIALYAIDPSSNSAPVTHLRTLQLFPSTSLFTYFSWHPTIPLLAAAALADGRVVLCDCSSRGATDNDEDDEGGAGNVGRTVTLHAHSLEAWVTSFSPDGTALYSGGDDAALKGEETDHMHRIIAPLWQWQDARTHDAGVTFILPLPLPSPSPSPSLSSQPQPQTTNPNAPILPPSTLLLTGSYDESLRLLLPPAPDGLGPRRSRVLAEIALGGGVWRVSVVDCSVVVVVVDDDDDEPTTATATATISWILLVSCMHAGTRVMKLTGRATSAGEGEEGKKGEREWQWDWGFEVLARFEEHQSMNYGSVVQPLVDGEKRDKGTGKRTVVSTSFYDRLVCVWEFESWVG
ncbi:uncharacterized protein IWZ02DRAFT_424354 [Phyllosticta citriasiana]|uniref:uncharacterized protein n=1 Tax=Phyllosticta citriasiana TaxID=595635 RepID=UPI0030FD58F2